MRHVSESPPVHRIAVIGSGVSGLTAAHVASRTSHVTLYEADDRLGGHADTHEVHEGSRPWRSTPASSCTTRAPTRSCSACSTSSASPPSRRRCRCRSATTARPGVGGALGLGGPVPDRPHPGGAATCGCSPRSLDFIAARGAARGAGRRAHAAAVPGRGRLLGLLRAALHGAAGGSGLVLRPRCGAGVPGALPVHLSRPPRDARRLRLAAVAHGHRRLPGVRRPAGRGPAGRAHRLQGHLDRGDRGRGQVTDGNGWVASYDGVVVATHPDQALSMLADPTAAQREVLGAAVLVERGHPAHRHLGAAGAAGAWASWNFRRPTRRHLRPDPAAAARHLDPLPGHPGRSGPGRPRPR